MKDMSKKIIFKCHSQNMYNRLIIDASSTVDISFIYSPNTSNLIALFFIVIAKRLKPLFTKCQIKQSLTRVTYWKTCVPYASSLAIKLVDSNNNYK